MKTKLVSIHLLAVLGLCSFATAQTPAAPRRMTPPPAAASVVEVGMPANPTEAELRAWPLLTECLVPISSADGPEVRTALAAALDSWVRRTNPDDHSALHDYARNHPASPWTPSIVFNLGLLSYESARFSQAVDHWRAAWESTSALTSAEGRTLADLALAQYCRMLARLGRKDDLSVIIKATKERTPQGASLQLLNGARESLSVMETMPGIAYRCGSFALASIQEHLNGKADVELLNNLQSPEGGFSLAQVVQMAGQAGLDMVAARRSPGAPVMVPSVVHWKLDHYAALLEEKEGRYLLKDPTFGGEHWISKDALDHEASGAFLIFSPQGSLPAGWQAIGDAEQSAIHGKGLVVLVVNGNGPGSGPTTAGPTPPPPQPDPPCRSSNLTGAGGDGYGGMAAYSLLPIPCSLVIRDSPIAYRPAFGPSMNFAVAYHQRETDQPTTMLFSNFGPLWEGEFTSYLEDYPGLPNENVSIHLRNGGYEIASGFNAGTAEFAKDGTSDTRLVRLGPNHYERRYKDGTKEVFSQAIGTTGPNRKVFLTQIVDAMGNALQLVYDVDPLYPSRLKFLVDATGLATELSYGEIGYPYLITGVSDPFGREAQFIYNDLAGQRRLVTIIDTIGIQSSFSYDSAGLVNALTTPYGRTQFDMGDFDGSFLIRFVEATGPTGLKERMEYRNIDAVYGTTLSDASVPTGPGLAFINSYLVYRNVFYWDRKAMLRLGGSVATDPAAAGANATIYHYLHAGSAASAILECVKRPLQSRVWFSYPNQPASNFVGTSAVSSASARVVEDGNGGTASEVTRREVNAQGNITKVIDPVGRETVYEYDTNGIDLRFVKQKIGGVFQTIAETQYNPASPPHVPWKTIDAAGQVTTYAYNTRGQVLSVTNPLGEVTTFAYEDVTTAPDFGKLKSITGALPGSMTSYTYDAAQRVRTMTDSSGYQLTYDYDDFDRLTRVTYPDGTYEETGYNRLDAVTRRDRMGRITQTKYNAIRQPMVTIDPAQRVLQYDYCSCGSMKLLVDGNGNKTKWDYDVLGRVTSKRYADNRGDDYAYEPLSGRLSSITDAKGQIKKYTYNLDGTLRKLDYQNEQIATPDVTYTYDPAFNRMATMVDGIGTHTWGYYPPGVLGALQVHTNDGPFVDPVPLTDLIAYTYDELGRVKTRNIGPTGTENKITWGYDALGRVISEVNNLCPQTPAPTQFTYNYVGTTSRLASVDYPNGQRTLYDYWPATTPGQPGNGDFRLKQIANFGQGIDPATLLSRFDYTYDPAGNILTWGRKLGAAATEQTYTLGYDEADQLTRGILSETANPNNLLYRYYATFDKSGNRLSKQENDILTGYSYNNLNQLTSSQGGGNLVVAGRTDELVSGVTVNGAPAQLLPGKKWEAVIPALSGSNTINVTASDLSQPPNHRTNSWTLNTAAETAGSLYYDLNGNSSITEHGAVTWNANDQLSADSSSEGSNFAFDGFGRRIALKGIDGALLAQWIWDGTTIAERRVNSSSAKIYGFGVSNDTGDRFYHTMDHLESAREITGEAGLLVRRYDYSILGSRNIIHASVDPLGLHTVGFCGLHHDTPSRILTWFRSYESSQGRWLNRDPAQESGGINLYAYAANNSVSKADQTGLSPWLACLLILSLYGDVQPSHSPNDFPFMDPKRSVSDQLGRNQNLATQASKQGGLTSSGTSAGGGNGGATPSGPSPKPSSGSPFWPLMEAVGNSLSKMPLMPIIPPELTEPLGQGYPRQQTL